MSRSESPKARAVAAMSAIAILDVGLLTFVRVRVEDIQNKEYFLLLLGSGN
jgi:hypothetical protein